jgi:hypothetical protein
MRYVRPQITGVFDASVLIQSAKALSHQEINPVFLTNGPAYQADE